VRYCGIEKTRVESQKVGGEGGFWKLVNIDVHSVTFPTAEEFDFLSGYSFCRCGYRGSLS